MVSEQLLNIKFVLEVEKYPCLYNYKLPEYVRKDMVDKAWFEIGKKFKMSGAECKEKWRNIRNVFVRNLKLSKKGSRERKKPYYLNEVMQFTIPYIKWSKVTIDGKPVTAMDTQTSYAEDSDDDDSGQHATASNPQVFADPQPSSEHYNNHAASPLSYPEPTPSPQPLSSVPIVYLQSRPEPAQSPQSPVSLMSPSPSDFSSSLFKEKSRKTKSSVEDGFIEYLKTKQARIETNHDLEQQPKKMFLLSLLPDLENMSDRQMRSFKTRVMRLIEDILDEKSSSTTVTANNSDVPVCYETRVKIEEADNDNFIHDN